MSEINRKLNLSGTLDAKLIKGEFKMARVMDSPSPPKTTSELLDGLCRKHKLSYKVVPGDGGQMKKVVVEDSDGVITSAAGSTVREAVVSLISKFGD